MNNSVLSPKVYTPEQVADMLQLNKNTVYDLISRGEIVAKRLGKVYRIPKSSLSFIFGGLDEDLETMQKTDEKNLQKVTNTLRSVRKTLWQKSRSF